MIHILDKANIMKYLIIIILFCSISCGCGVYSVYSKANPHLNTIAIRSFENESIEYGLEGEIRDKLNNKFISDNRLKVVDIDPDVEVIGKILSYEKPVYSYDMNEQPKEHKLEIKFSITINDMVKNKVLWQNQNLVLSAIYNENLPQGTESTENRSEEEAFEEVIEKLFEKLLSNTVEEW